MLETKILLESLLYIKIFLIFKYIDYNTQVSIYFRFCYNKYNIEFLIIFCILCIYNKINTFDICSIFNTFDVASIFSISSIYNISSIINIFDISSIFDILNANYALDNKSEYK